MLFSFCTVLILIDDIHFPSENFHQPVRNDEVGADSADLGQMIDAAIAAPAEFPAIDQFVFAGDSVALVLLENLPNADKVLKCLLASILSRVSDPHIIVVFNMIHSKKISASYQAEIHASHPNITIDFSQHDPKDQSSVACMATNVDGHPVYINRLMFDADVVIPVGSMMATQFNDELSSYPEFSDEKTQKRFKQTTGQQLRPEIRLAEQNLGAECFVIVVPAPSGAISSVRVGQRNAISSIAASESDSLWSIPDHVDGELVVATIETNPENQTWEQLFQAINVARASSPSARQIAICTAIKTPPSSTHREILDLQFETDLEARQRSLANATELHRRIYEILQSTSVFLVSELEEDEVEDCGFGFVESTAQLQKIVDAAKSGVVLRDAHLCQSKLTVPQ